MAPTTKQHRPEVAKPNAGLAAAAASLERVAANLSASADAMLELAELHQRPRPTKLKTVAVGGGMRLLDGMALSSGDMLTTDESIPTDNLVSGLLLVQGVGVVVERPNRPDLVLPLSGILGVVVDVEG